MPILDDILQFSIEFMDLKFFELLPIFKLLIFIKLCFIKDFNVNLISLLIPYYDTLIFFCFLSTILFCEL